MAEARTYQQYVMMKWLILISLVIFLLASCLVSLMAGSADISAIDVLKTVSGHGSRQMNSILWNVRLPRMAAAIAVGTALSMCGCIMQNVLRNPLASASTLGVSQGASFGAAVAIVFLGAGSQVNTALSISNPYAVSICAFAGGMITTIAILMLSRMRESTPSVMVLAGVALSSVFSGGTTLIQYFSDDVMVASIVYWTFGNLGRAGWSEICLIAILSAAAFLFFVCNSWNYNAIESGHDSARSLGVNTSVLIPASLAVCALIASVSVAFTGCISFIGLIASHIARRFVGNDYRFLVPCSALTGAILLIITDIVCRMAVSPVVLPIGAITSFMGAPLFLYLIIRQRRGR